MSLFSWIASLFRRKPVRASAEIQPTKPWPRPRPVQRKHRDDDSDLLIAAGALYIASSGSDCGGDSGGSFDD